jgi:hypothetical protein
MQEGTDVDIAIIAATAGPVTTKENKPLTLSWENISVQSPGSKDTLGGKIMFCKKPVPPKPIVKNGN